jgi:hypothetical protein
MTRCRRSVPEDRDLIAERAVEADEVLAGSREIAFIRLRRTGVVRRPG